LHVANGFKAELLQAVNGDEIRLQEELAKAAPWVGTATRGPQLFAKVRARLIEQVKGGKSAKPTGESTRESIRRFSEEAEEKLKQQQRGRLS
jgi:hypothetical protein